MIINFLKKNKNVEYVPKFNELTMFRVKIKIMTNIIRRLRKHLNYLIKKEDISLKLYCIPNFMYTRKMKKNYSI